MFEFVAIQAGKGQPVYVSSMVTPEAIDEVRDMVYEKMDHELLRSCGYLDRNRLRLMYEHDLYHSGLLREARPCHAVNTEGVHLLDGPKQGEFYPERPPSTRILFPVFTDYRHYEYRIHRFRDLLLGIWDERSGRGGQ